MNTRQKGNRVRKKVMDNMSSLNFLVGVVERTGRFIKEKDLYGLFDLVAVRNDCVAFVQVTCNKPHSHKSLIAFSRVYASDNVLVLQYVWKDRVGFEVYKYGKNDYKLFRGVL